MQGANALLADPGSTLVAIGNFDGVHLGHVSVLTAAVREAKERALTPVVLTFHPHPAVVLGRDRLPLLTPLDRKCELILRIDPSIRIVVEPFTRELAGQSPVEFAGRLIAGSLGAKVVLVGDNFRFGKGRAGDLAELKELGRRFGFEARSEELSGDAQGFFSSTRIREVLIQGALDEATRMLGRPHSLSGEVKKGEGRGRELGAPTANLSGVEEALPSHGVYSVLVDQGRESGSFSALGSGVANVGDRPTLGAGFSIEVHVFDQELSLYGERLRIHLIQRLRPERRFASLVELREQIAKDMLEAKKSVFGREPDPNAGGAWF